MPEAKSVTPYLLTTRDLLLIFEVAGVAAEEVHDCGRGLLLLQLAPHVVHIGRDVVKELIKPSTEVIEPRLSILILCEAVLGTLAPAGEEVGTLSALPRQGIVLISPKPLLPRAIHHLYQRAFADISQLVLREDEVIAAVDIPIILHHAGVTAVLRHRADARLDAHPIGERGIEELDEVLPYPVSHPDIKEAAEEVAPLLRRDGEGGQPTLSVRLSDSRQPTIRMVPFHNGGKLYVVAANGLKERVKPLGVIGIERIDDGEDIEVHPVPLQQSHPTHHAIKGGLVARRASHCIVTGTISIKGDADKEVVRLKKSTPLIIEQSTIGLKRIDDAVPSGILALEPNRLLIKREGTQKRLTPVPGNDHLLGRLAADVLSHIPLQQLIAHLLVLR